MPDYQSIENELTQMLGLSHRPIAVKFQDAEPAVPKHEHAEPAGCSFWSIAAGGQSFYTVPSDHYNCPIGSYTHNIALPEERASELSGILNLMKDIGYIRMEEVAGIPRLPQTPGFIMYSPLGDAKADPDVVLVSGRPASIMLLQEAAQRAAVAANLPMLARPTCMAIPAAMTAGVVFSSGCIGNRVYTQIGDDEIYAVIPGRQLELLLAELRTISQANATLRQHHENRRQQFA